jgi:hypothetical protein
MSDGAAGSEGRRPKASKGGNRGNGYGVSVPCTLSYRGLKCAHNSDATARILLNGDFMFCAS